ncbi:glycoside hydrolase [Nitrosomonas sp.]|uniref:glycoside hydrolase n=1 Tax=Nitrosomonas sp. TaxID=42353 RepID=UPI0026164B68|nr:glycoside hydrolase [Nitrosomonas sp.]
MQIENIIKIRVNTTSTHLAKKIHNTLTTLLFTLSIILATWGTYAIGAVTPNPIKWHPGHYVMLVSPGQDSAYYMDQIYNELDTYSAIRGIAIRYNWAELEPAKGVYDFASIDKHLTELAARDKRLIILLEIKSFDPNEILIPDYLKAAIYEGGVFAHTKGYNLKLWNTAVRDRLGALVRALGKHLNAHPNFEGFGLQETAMGQPLKPLTSAQIDTYYKNLLSINQRMRNNFPNTMTFQLTNYPRGILDSLINELKTMGATLGATDIFPQEPGLNFPGSKHSPRGLYTYFPQLNGVIPLLAQVEKANYENTKHDDTGYQPTITELFNFGKDKLHANYILWTRSPGYYDDVLLMLNQTAQKSTLSGGLNSACPTSIASCID